MSMADAKIETAEDFLELLRETYERNCRVMGPPPYAPFPEELGRALAELFVIQNTLVAQVVKKNREQQS